MINDYAEGGLKMIDIQSFSKALKATWIRKYLDTSNQGKWKLFLSKIREVWLQLAFHRKS